MIQKSGRKTHRYLKLKIIVLLTVSILIVVVVLIFLVNQPAQKQAWPVILRTKDFVTYEFVGVIPNLPGKVAPYILLNPDDGKFYMFYSDWGNVIRGDIDYARLGLAIGNFSEDFSSCTFEDQGYLCIESHPLPLGIPEAGWDPYIVKIGENYYMIFSLAKHGVHLAKASQLGTNWTYVRVIVNDTRENPALFSYQGTWYMLVGIYNGSGYDLYSSEDFLSWTLKERDWFTDLEYPVLPAGSTCALVNSTLYHLYQVPRGPDPTDISGPFSLKLAFSKLVLDVDWWKKVEWSYIEEETVTPSIVQTETKDPEFFRLPNHTLFKDNANYYYLTLTCQKLVKTVEAAACTHLPYSTHL